MKRVLKWLAVLVALAGVVLLVLFFSREAILRRVAIANLREQTGLVADIGKFHVGLREPVIQITDFTLHNPAGFGDAPLLVIKEAFVEYDQRALAEKKVLHITRARLNLAELNIVKNPAGKTNLFELGLEPAVKGKKKKTGLKEFKERTGLDFAGIDELEVSIGTARFIDLKNPQNSREQAIAIENQKFKIKSEADLSGLVVLLALRSGDFFSDVFGGDIWKDLK